MNVWWYVARSGGIVAWLLLAAAMIWGLLLSTRLLQERRKPAWLLDLHRWLAGLSVTFTGVHLLGLVLDDYVEFGARELFVPFASSWNPGAVAWGIVALYILVAVQGTSLLMRRLPRRAWKAVHLLSFGLFFTAAIHGAQAGTDAGAAVYRYTTAGILITVAFTTAYRVLTGGSRKPRGRPAVASAGAGDA